MVGSAVNIAARVEGATVGGQVFITTATYSRIRDVAEVAEPVAIQMKGLRRRSFSTICAPSVAGSPGHPRRR